MAIAEKNTETKKKYWFKIINKNKDNVILVPPHKKDEKVDLKTYTWEEFNSLFVFDETDKNKCYLIKEPEKEVKKTNIKPKINKNKKKLIKKEKTPKKVVVTNNTPRAKIKPPRGSEYECTMSIGDMIKNSTK